MGIIKLSLKNKNNLKEDEYRSSRIKKLEELKDAGVEPYPSKFIKTNSTNELQEKYKDLSDGEEIQDIVKIAGRIKSIRNSGMFIDLYDPNGKIQVFSHEEKVSLNAKAVLKNLDVGDFIGVEGNIRRTKRGELTVNSKDIVILSKSLRPLPEKYHGLSDIELKYRYRHLDLIMNSDSCDVLKKRSLIISEIRRFLIDQGFLEVETPMLHPIPGGAAARPFITHHNALDMKLYLRIAPELYLKRLIIGGISEKVFEINRTFRNEGISTTHNPEFTLMEIYQAYADYKDMMSLVESIVTSTAKKIIGSLKVNYAGNEIDLTPPWPCESMINLIKKYTGVDFLELTDLNASKEAALKIGVDVQSALSWGKVVEDVFEKKVQINLVQPIHVKDYPLDISPLAKVRSDNDLLTERFETFVNCDEIANAFSELTDPIDQKNRFIKQASQRVAGNEDAHRMDEDFIVALEQGMPPTGGLGIGIDRLVMLLTDSQNIRDVILFPTLRKKNG